MNKPLSRALSGSGGGGGAGNAPTIVPDTLLSKDIVEFTLGICEGPIAGLVNGPRGFYLDDTPLVSPSGDNNFNPFELHVYHGDAIASEVRNVLGGVVSNAQVGVQLAEAIPVVRTTPSSLRNEIDRIEIRLKFNALIQTNSNGDQLEETARFKLKYRAAGSSTWLNFYPEGQGAKLTMTSTYIIGDGGIGRGSTGSILRRRGTIPQSGNLAEKDPFTGQTLYTVAGQVSDTSLAGYDVSSAGLYGKFYLNTTDATYIYVEDPVALAALTKGETDTFQLSNSHHTSSLSVKVQNIEIVELYGKTTSGYVKDFVKGVPRQNNDWEIQVTKLSEDNLQDHTVTMAWESIQFVTQGNRSYDNLAVIRGLGQASDQFSSIPRFSGVYGCLIIKVPSNYDPITRYCTGAWDGTFKLAHTDNLAWCIYDLMTNELYGLRRYYPHLIVDRYSIYDAAKWCDELVPRPGGGYQPRFTYNDKIEQPRDAIELIYQLAGIMGAIPITDLNGTVRLKIDQPGLPSQIFGPENITPEGFQYSFSDVTQRPNDIMVKFINPNLDFEEDVRQVFNQTLIEANGRIPDEMVALGCNDVYEAQRRAYRRLLQANTEITTTTFQTARMGLGLELFDLIGIMDPVMNWGVSGRVKSFLGSTITLRDSLFLPINTDLAFQIQTSSGVYDLTVQTTQQVATELNIVSGIWPVDAPAQAQFGISAPDVGLVKPFRVLNIEEDTSNSEQLTITALEQNVNKYSDADNMLSSGTVDYASNNAKFPDAPVVTNVQSGTDHLFVNADGKIVSRIFLEWDHNPSSFVDDFIIHYRRMDIDQNFSQFQTRGRQAYIDNVQDNVNYTFFVQAVNAVGRKSRENYQLEHTVVGKTEEPDDVIGLTATQTGPDVLLEYTAVDDLDLRHYEIRSGVDGDTWETASVIGSEKTNSFIIRNVQGVAPVYFVKAVDTSGNKSINAAVLNYSTPAPMIPSASISIDQDLFVIDIIPNAVEIIPLSEYIVRYNNNIVFRGMSSVFSGVVNWVGARSFSVTARNLAGVESSVVTVSATVVAPSAPTLSLSVVDTAFKLKWNIPKNTLPISHYVVTDATSVLILGDNVKENAFSQDINWLGDHSLEVYAVDTAGNAGAVGVVSLNIIVPTVTGLQSPVVRSILQLEWIGNKDLLPIQDYHIYEGTTFGTSVEIGQVDARNFSIPVTWSGSKTYYVVATDSAGNTSVPTSVTETIDPPGQPSVLAQVVDQTVQLSWVDNNNELLVDKHILKSQLEWKQPLLDPATGVAESDIASVILDTDKLIISTIGVPTFTTSGQTSGYRITLPKEHTKQWYGSDVRIRVRAASIGASPTTNLRVAYSADEVGSSSQSNLVVTASPQWYEFVYTVPSVGGSGAQDHYISLWADAGKDVAVWEIELITKEVEFQIAKGSTATFPADFLGTSRFFVTPIDEAGNVGSTGEITLLLDPPQAFSFTSKLQGNLVDLSWEDPQTTLPVVFYTLKRGADYNTSTFLAQSMTNSYSFPIDWAGTETFWITATDTTGNESAVQSSEVLVAVPTAPIPRSEVIDNNVILRWANGTGTLPVVSTEIRKGTDFATAEVLQTVDATFAAFFEFKAGSYTYWVVNIDSAGNYGAQVAIATIVNEPPDFILHTSFSSDFSGTLSRVILDNTGLLFGLDSTETIAEHFVDNSFTNPQDQIDAGYPIFIQPIDHTLLSSYQEEYDAGVFIGSSIITVTPTIQSLAGNGSIQIDIEYRETTGDAWIKQTNVTQVYAQNFRYIRFTLRLVANSADDLIQVTKIDVRLNIKIRNDAGAGFSNSTDTLGTVVNFNVAFLDIVSITVTPNTTTPIIPVYDFVDIPNPTSFKVYLYDKNGIRVSGDFSWAARGF